MPKRNPSVTAVETSSSMFTTENTRTGIPDALMASYVESSMFFALEASARSAPTPLPLSWSFPSSSVNLEKLKFISEPPRSTIPGLLISGALKFG